MATIGDYINGKVSSLRLELSDVDIEAMLLKSGLQSTDTLTSDNIRAVEISLLIVIPELLLRPDKTTGDTSLKWDRGNIIKYYTLKCAEYGLPDALKQENSITYIDLDSLG